MSRIQELKRNLSHALQDSSWADALAVLAKLVDLEGSQPAYHNQIGDILLKSGRREEAMQSFMRGIRAYRELGMFPNGAALCKKVLRLDPDQHEAIWLLGELKTRQGFLADGAEKMLEALRSFAEDPKGDRGVLLGLLEQGEKLQAGNKAVLEFVATTYARIAEGDRARCCTLRIAEIEEREGNTAKAEELRHLADELNPDASLPPVAEPAAPELVEADSVTSQPELAASDLEEEPSSVPEAKAGIEQLRITDADGTDPEEEPEPQPEPAAAPAEPAPPEARPPEGESPAVMAPAAASPADSAAEVAASIQCDEVESTGPATWAGRPVAGAPGPEIEQIKWEDCDPEGEAAPAPPLAAADETALLAASMLEQLQHGDKLPEVELLKTDEGCEEDLLSTRQVVDNLRFDLAGEADDVEILGEAHSKPAPVLESGALAELMAEPPGDAGESDDGNEQLELLAMNDELQEAEGDWKTPPAENEDMHRQINLDQSPAPIDFGLTTTAGEALQTDDIDAVVKEFKRRMKEQMGGMAAEERYQLGVSYMEMGLHEEALEEFEHTLEHNVLGVKTREWMARCLLALDRPREIVLLLQTSLDAETYPRRTMVELYYFLGQAYEELDACDLALDAYTKVYQLDPNFEQVKQKLAKLTTA